MLISEPKVGEESSGLATDTDRSAIARLWLSGGVGYVAENLSRVGHVQ